MAGNCPTPCRRTASNRVAVPHDLFTFIKSHWRPQANNGASSAPNGVTKSDNHGSRPGTPARSGGTVRRTRNAAVIDVHADDDAMEVNGAGAGAVELLLCPACSMTLC